jgi:hypothetical protein
MARRFISGRSAASAGFCFSLSLPGNGEASAVIACFNSSSLRFFFPASPNPQDWLC